MTVKLVHFADWLSLYVVYHIVMEYRVNIPTCFIANHVLPGRYPQRRCSYTRLFVFNRVVDSGLCY